MNSYNSGDPGGHIITVGIATFSASALVCMSLSLMNMLISRIMEVETP